MKSKTIQNLATFIVFVALCIVTSIALAQSLPTLGDSSSEDLSPVAERKIGEEIMRGVRANRDYIDDAVVNEYINAFGATLLDAHHEARGEANFDYVFFVVRDSRINAFALPGGFIGVHSELIVTAENESQLASVLAHEIGHVAQRHIARMIGNQKQDALIPITSLILAALTMHASPDAAMALAVGGQGFAVQRQLNFSQNAEREADRVGLQIMRDGGFDPSDMVAFFERMQQSARAYSDNVPAFLRTHPMTTERIADIQLRIKSDHFKKHRDDPDYALFRARVRVLQDDSTQGLLNAQQFFLDQLERNKSDAAANYGLAFIAFKQNEFKAAQDYLDRVKAPLRDSAHRDLFLTNLQLDILLRSEQNTAALKEAKRALQAFPTSRSIDLQYVSALMANHEGDKAILYLREQTRMHRTDFELQRELAKAYASENKEALEHMALAEFYALSGALSAALDQLSIAKASSDATEFDLAIIDARERELKQKYEEAL